MKKALTIAGSDSSAGAGIQADLKTFAAHAVYGTCAVTAITAQSTLGIFATYPIPADLVTAQIEAVAGDIGVDAVKTGMLSTAAIVEAVAAAIDALELPSVVVDPVMRAKRGECLLDEEAVAALRAELLSRAFVVTPNRMEAEALSGLPIESMGDARRAAERILALGPAAVIITGGHLAGPEAIDLVYDGHEFTDIRGPRLASPNTHGAGCTYSAALAANLALGRPLVTAAAQAKRYVEEAIRRSEPVGQGYGPLKHWWNE